MKRLMKKLASNITSSDQYVARILAVDKDTHVRFAYRIDRKGGDV